MRLLLLAGLLAAAAPGAEFVRKVVFTGEKSEHRWALKEIDPNLPSDWSGYQSLVLELRHSSPQRFYLFAYDKGGARRIVIQPYGQGVWIRASVPLRYFQRRDFGNNMANVNNRGTPSFWMSVWGPFGPINNVEALGITMDYPLRKPVIEIRSITLTKDDPGSAILEKLPVVDEFGQWIHADWPRKIRSLEQLKSEWAAEDRTLKPGEFGYCSYGGHRDTAAKATGYFRVEKIGGRWWFVDPDGHLYLSKNIFGMTLGYPAPKDQRENYYKEIPKLQFTLPGLGMNPANSVPLYAANLERRFGENWRQKSWDLEIRRMEAWGLNTGAGLEHLAWGGAEGWKPRKPYTAMLRVNQDPATTVLGMPDVYGEPLARAIDDAAKTQCAPRREDKLLLGYYVGNEPPWPGRESELVNLLLAGPATATQANLKSFLAQGDTPARRDTWVRQAFDKYLAMMNAAVKRHDPNHLNIGMRFGGQPPDYLIAMGKHFDVISFNPYEYSPLEHMERAYKLLDRPILFGEFQFGVPENGLGGSLVQTASQAERGIAYRYYLEQAATHPAFVGASWYTGVDLPVLSRTENYNIGFIDVTDRPYPEMVREATAAHRNLYKVHLGKARPFSRLPRASEAGTPRYRLSDAF